MTRALMCGLLLVAVGCGAKPDTTPAAKERPRDVAKIDPPVKPKDKTSELPISDSKLRYLVGDVYNFYRDRDTEEASLKHTSEGKRVVVSLVTNAYGVEAAANRLILEDSANLFRRPRSVFLLRTGTGWSKGDMTRFMCIEGVLKGPVGLNSRPWSKDWANLTANNSGPLADMYILYDDARVVACEPK